MNISKQQVDALNLILSVEIDATDYMRNVGKILREYRQKSNMPGFRPGKVPEGLILKIYGKAVLVDEINKLVTDAVAKYIDEEKLHVLGDPIPTTKSDDLDWAVGNNFRFDFEIGVPPVIDLNLSDKDQLVKYKIAVDKEILHQRIDWILSERGHFVSSDAVADFSEKLTGNILQLDSHQQPAENGLKAENTTVLLSRITDDKFKPPFENAKVNDEIVFNLSETFPPQEVSSILKNTEKTGDLKDVLFRFTITGIDQFVKAEPTRQLFDDLYGEGVIHSQEEFESRIESEIAGDLEEASMFKFSADVQKYLIEKIAPPLPDQYLRKYLWERNKDKINESDFEQRLPNYLKEVQWSVISAAVTEKFDLKVNEPEVIDYAGQLIRKQFSQFGITDISNEESLNIYVSNYLKEEQNVRQIVHTLLDKKVIQAIMKTAHTEIKEISREEYEKLVSSEQREEK